MPTNTTNTTERLTLQLPPALIRQAKARAAVLGMGVSEWAQEVLYAAVDKSQIADELTGKAKGA
jgi:hypothetical protein